MTEERIKRINELAGTIIRLGSVSGNSPADNIKIIEGILYIVAAEARKEGIRDGRRMQELERSEHTGQGYACELCREYQELKKKL